MMLSIILPARNEELLIKDTLTDISNYLSIKKIADYELLVIINGTQDKTVEIVEELTRKNKKIKISKSTSGYGKALKLGLKKASGKYVIIFNVDFYDLKLIDLISIDLYGKDIIVGSKMAHWSEDYRAISRKLISLAFNTYLKIFYKFRGSDTHGIKLIRNNVIKKILPKCKTDEGIFDTEFVLRAQYYGFKFADFPVVVEEKRPPRFKQRILETPRDIFSLHKALKY